MTFNEECQTHSAVSPPGPSEVPQLIGKLIFIARQAGMLVLGNRVDQGLVRRLSTSKNQPETTISETLFKIRRDELHSPTHEVRVQQNVW